MHGSRLMCRVTVTHDALQALMGAVSTCSSWDEQVKLAVQRSWGPPAGGSHRCIGIIGSVNNIVNRNKNNNSNSSNNNNNIIIIIIIIMNQHQQQHSHLHQQQPLRLLAIISIPAALVEREKLSPPAGVSLLLLPPPPLLLLLITCHRSSVNALPSGGEGCAGGISWLMRLFGSNEFTL
jgi:hypothetical protein